MTIVASLLAPAADLISLQDAMEELDLGPNGGLVYCMEYLLDNMDWLKDELDKYDDEEYIVFDCPGQVLLEVFDLFPGIATAMIAVLGHSLRVIIFQTFFPKFIPVVEFVEVIASIRISG